MVKAQGQCRQKNEGPNIVWAVGAKQTCWVSDRVQHVWPHLLIVVKLIVKAVYSDTTQLTSTSS